MNTKAFAIPILTALCSQSDLITLTGTYCMAQNFDSGKFSQIRIGKILTIKNLTNANVFIYR